MDFGQIKRRRFLQGIVGGDRRRLVLRGLSGRGSGAEPQRHQTDQTRSQHVVSPARAETTVHRRSVIHQPRSEPGRNHVLQGQVLLALRLVDNGPAGQRAEMARLEFKYLGDIGQ